MKGKDYLYAALGLAAAYVAYRVVVRGERILDGVGNFWDALTFSSATLGEPAQLTSAARMSQADYIREGYLAVNADGSTTITPSGEAYIAQQRAMQ